MTYAKVGKKVRRDRALKLLDRVGLLARADHMPNEMSGGQRQRVAIARALANEPPLILADEPTGALDSNAAKQLLNTFSTLCSEYHATILMVTHDVMAASYCDRLYFMRDGRIKASLHREQENKQAFFAKILEKITWIEGEGHDVL